MEKQKVNLNFRSTISISQEICFYSREKEQKSNELEAMCLPIRAAGGAALVSPSPAASGADGIVLA